MSSYKQIGPFVYGDPRFLAGGSAEMCMRYGDARVSVNDGQLVVPPAEPVTSSYEAMRRIGQGINKGKCGYHGTYCTNCFVGSSDLSMPTVGVELETVMRKCERSSADKLARSLYSNWFHFENDGSLDRAHSGNYGYELVTTVLPARYYRDIEVWTGLQNLISPLLMSYDTDETGLHVHVGMEWFDNVGLQAMPANMSIAFGKLLTSRVYYSLVPRAFAKRVFLRKGDMGYCRETTDPKINCHRFGRNGHEFIDDTVYEVLSAYSAFESSQVEYANRVICTGSHGQVSRPTDDGGMRSTSMAGVGLGGGHATEVNSEPRLTLEFRRGKGTTNALSIHRIVEMCVVTTLYAGYIVDNPSEEVSTKKYLEFLAGNTKSPALKTLAEAELSKNL